MLLSTYARKYLLASLDEVSGKPQYSVYRYLQDPARLKALIPKATVYALLNVPALFRDRVIMGLNELYTVADRLERELSNPSKLAVELARSVVESLVLDKNEKLIDFISKHFLELGKFVVFEMVEVSARTSRYCYHMFINVKKSDLTRILSMFPSYSPYDSVYTFVLRALKENPLFREFLYAFAGRFAELDPVSLEARVAGESMRLSPEAFARLAIAFNRSDLLKQHFVNQYGDWIRRLSERINVPVCIADAEITSVHDFEANVKLVVDDVSRLVGKPLSQNIRVVAVIKYQKAKPRSLAVEIHHGGFKAVFDNVGGDIDLMLTEFGNILLSQGFRNLVEVVDSTVDFLRTRGYTLSEVFIDPYLDTVSFKASGNGFTLEYSVDYNDKRAKTKLKLRAPKPVAAVYQGSRTWLTGHVFGAITVDGDELVLEATGDVSLPKLQLLEEAVLGEADKLAKKWKSKYDSLPEQDAVSIYVMYKWQGVSRYELLERLGITPALLSLKASRALGKLTRLPPRIVVERIEYAAKDGIVDLDDEGYVRVLGRRLVDVSEQYFVYEKPGEVTERRVLDRLLYYNDTTGILDTLVNRKQALSRIVRILVEELRSHVNMPHAQDILLGIAGNRDLWMSLAREDRLLVARALGKALVDEARSKNWSWVVEDSAVVTVAYVSGLASPSDITRVLATELPSALGSGYELVVVGNEHFIKYGKTYLQVRKVLHNGFLFQGATVGSSIGMFVKAKTVDEASRVIQDNLVDNVLDFKQLVQELKSSGIQVAVGKYENPAFYVPCLLVKTGDKQVTIPLQVNFREAVNRMLKKAVEAEESEEDVLTH